MDEGTLAVHVERARQGDGRSFEALVSGLSGMLLATAYRYTGDWECSRDLSQETWLSVFRSLGRLDAGIPFKPWLLAIHRNRCIDHLRRRRRSREVPADSVQESGYAEAVDAAPAPDEELCRKRRLEAVLRAAGRLPRGQRRVFALVDLEGIPCGEAARAIGMREVTLRTNLYHARRKVARDLRRSGVMEP